MADILQSVANVWTKRLADMGDGTHAEVVAVGGTVPVSHTAWDIALSALRDALTGILKVQGVAGGVAVGVDLTTQLDDTNDVVAVGDGSGNKLFTTAYPGEVKSVEAGVDNSVFTASTSRLLAGLGGICQSGAQAAASVLTNNRLGLARLTKRRAQVVVRDSSVLQLTPATPVPANSDIVNAAGGPIVAGDLAIRDTNPHVFLINMADTASGPGIWSDVTILLYASAKAPLNQDLTVTIASASAGSTAMTTLATFTFAKDAMRRIGIGSAAGGQGSAGGGASAADKDWYSVPALACPHSKLILTLQASVAPESGEISAITIIRRA